MKKKENIRAERKEQSAKSEELRAESRGQRAKGGEQRTESREQGAKGKEQATSIQQPATSNQQPVTREISTVFNIKKPSANGIYIPAEGCISESRAIRACLMIRVFNN